MKPPTVGVMSDTPATTRGAVSETRMVLNLSVYLECAGDLGAHTPQERRALVGVSRTTEWRWMHGVSVPSHSRARAVAATLKTTTRELFPEVAA